MASSRWPRTGILLLVAGFLAWGLCAQGSAGAAEIPLDDKGLPLWQIKEWTDFPVRLELARPAELDALLARVPIASFDREQLRRVTQPPRLSYLEFTPRVTEAEAAALRAAGYDFERLPDLERAAREATERAWAERAAAKSGPPLTEVFYYPTHAEIGQILADIATNYSDLARTFQWGVSVQGRELWGIVISDDVHNSAAEAEVRLSSSLHGNEPVDIVLLLNFAQYLTENYGQPGYDDVTNLVDNYEIHIMPLCNPDGYVVHSRENANGVDLNRNFPLPDGQHPSQEQETVNFMSHALHHDFVISQNGHGGALVVNYPWDFTYTLAPDNDALIQLSLEYSTYNLPMYNSPVFDQGITNGAQWYVTQGCLQDWSYDQTDCMDVTIEVSNQHWPNESTLDNFWDDNRESLMHFVKAARYGVNGLVSDAGSGAALATTIMVTGIDMPVHTDPEYGDYYKLLDTGTYEITFTAEGYYPQTITDVATTWGTPTVLDVEMVPLAAGLLSGVVTDMQGNGLDATVEIYTYPDLTLAQVLQADAAAGGAYSTSLNYGEYQVTASETGYIAQEALVTLTAEPTTLDFVLAAAEEVDLFADDFENGTGQWNGGWALADPPEGYESDNSLTDSPGGDYPSNDENATVMAASVDLSEVITGELSFHAKWEIEADWDCVVLEISLDGGQSWTAVPTQHTVPASGQGVQDPAGMPVFEGNQLSWVSDSIDLTPWFGEADVTFRFVLKSDGSGRRDGFYLDDFRIHVIRPESSTPVPPSACMPVSVTAYPNPFNPQTTIAYAVARSGQVDLAVYDLKGRMVRRLVAQSLAAGNYEVNWDGSTETGGRAGSGVYFARLVTAEEHCATKLVLVK